MTSLKLKDRIESYQDACNFKLLNKLPIITVVNGRSFFKLTSLIDKPYCQKFSECMLSTMHKLCTEIEGAVFAFQYNDEIVIISRNDQSIETAPWYDNKIQKICSITSSIATLHFNNCVQTINLDLLGECFFISQIFTPPTISEAINTIIYKQQNNFYTSVQSACFYELLKKYDKNTIKEMLIDLSVDQKIDLLQQECKIDFNDYPLAFKRGAAAYKVPKIMEDGTTKSKWIINASLPIFTKEQSFISNILKNGSDIFRKDNL